MSQDDTRIVTRPPARRETSSFRLLAAWEEWLSRNFHKMPFSARRRWARLLVRTILQDSAPERSKATTILLAIRTNGNPQIPEPTDTAALEDWLEEQYPSPARRPRR